MNKQLIFLVMGLFLLSFASAATFDNVLIEKTFEKTKDYNKLWDTYKPIQIDNSFGFGSTVLEASLDKHDDTCGVDCSSEMTITLYEDSVLIDDVKFYTLEGDKRTEEPISFYEFLYSTDGLTWNHYNLGQEVSAGTYSVKLNGQKNALKTVDWIIKTQGETIDAWATWTSDLNTNLVAYFKLDDTTGNVIESVSRRDAQSNGTTRGVAGIINNSFDFESTEKDTVILNNSIINFTGSTNFTINLWMKAESISGGNIFVGTNTPGGYFAGILNSTGNLFFGDYGQVSSNSNLGKIGIGGWNMVTFMRLANNTIRFYVNGTFKDEIAQTDTYAAVLMTLGNFADGAGFYDGLMDEIGFWNGSLTATQISNLYNSGSGITLADTITVNSPTNNSQVTTGSNVTFNVSLVSLANMTNITLYFNGALNETQSISGTSNSTNFYKVLNANTSYNFVLCTLSLCTNSSNYTIQTANLVTNSISFNSSTFETATESFVVNVSANSSLTAVNLLYNSTSYAMTNLSDGRWSYTLDVPQGNGNSSVQFQYTYGGSTLTSNTSNQTVSVLTFATCNVTFSTEMLNVTFQDESNASLISAAIPSSTFNYYLGTGTQSKNYTLTNNTQNLNYTFCGSTNITFYVTPYVQYSATNYPQRIWNPAVQSYSNATTLQVLYLLSNTNGDYITLQVVNVGNQVLEDVIVTATRSISGVVTLVGSGTTDAAGLVTFWLNPDFEHTFNFTLSGYDFLSTSFSPTQSSYTITLAGGSVSADDYNQGVSRFITPSASSLVNNTTYIFTFNLTSSYWQVSSFGFNLRLANGTIIAGGTSVTEGTAATKSYNTNNQSQIWMDYYWIIDGNNTNGTYRWVVFNDELTDWSITHFFDDLNAYLTVGMFGIDDFGRYLIIFLILFTSVGLVSYKYGLSSPLAVSTMTFAIIYFFDVTVNLIPTINGITNLPTYLAALILVLVIFRQVTSA